MTLRRAGRLHHLQIGAAHARRRVLAIVDEQEVTVVALDTGELLSTHLIEPDQGLLAQPTTETPADGRGLRRPCDHLCPDSCVTDVATHDSGGDEGTRTPDPRDANAVLSQLSYIPTGVAV